MDFSVDVRAFVIELSQISSFFTYFQGDKKESKMKETATETVSVAESIHVPYRPHTNLKEATLLKEYVKGYKSETGDVLCQDKYIP